jgi:DNA-binding response OmpR family regulator
MNAQLLLVEDDDAVADVVRLHLVQAGFAVHREADGRHAMAAVDRQRWDLVLLDLTLPGADGLDVCRHIRQARGGTQREADTERKHLPVIMLSARAGETHRVLGLELGADDYLPKPFSMLELTARVRALLRRVAQMRQEAAAPQPLHMGRWQLCPVQRSLLHDGQPVPLTLREFDLLHFLLRHPRQVFSRAQLLERVWGPGFDGYEHTVNSHINRLRNKLETDPHNPRLICTVWGVGYRFEPPAAPAP